MRRKRKRKMRRRRQNSNHPQTLGSVGKKCTFAPPKFSLYSVQTECMKLCGSFCIDPPTHTHFPKSSALADAHPQDQAAHDLVGATVAY